MPPKIRYEREKIIEAGFAQLREGGAESVTARSVAARLGCSVAPVFSAFANMEELWRSITDRAYRVYTDYIEEGLKAEIPFKGVGVAYIEFAIREPNLFKKIFMSDGGAYGLDDVLKGIDPNFKPILQSISDCYGLGEEAALNIYKHMWIYTHGIAVLCVTGTCAFKPEEISAMLTDVCIGLIKNVKN